MDRDVMVTLHYAYPHVEGSSEYKIHATHTHRCQYNVRKCARKMLFFFSLQGHEIAAAHQRTSENVKEPEKSIAQTHHRSGNLRCIIHRTAECHSLRKQSAYEQMVSSSSVSVLRERKPSAHLIIVRSS